MFQSINLATLMRFSLITLSLVSILMTGASCATSASRPDSDPEMLPIWPGNPPGVQNPSTELSVTERSQPPELRDRFATGISHPTLQVFPAANPSGVGMLVLPGGGYQRVVMDKEGYEVAEWLAEQGITAFVLLYRLPGENWSDGANTPLQDTQRSLRWIRQHAAEWGVDATKVGVVGFSAGGHAAASLVTRYGETVYSPLDAVDQQSARPDFAALIYPVISLRNELTHEISRNRLLGDDYSAADIAAHSPEQNVHAGMPPVFLLHSADDESVPVGNSLELFAALRAADVPAEMHIYADGGHGFGLRYTKGKSVEVWPEVLHSWIRFQTEAKSP